MLPSSPATASCRRVAAWPMATSPASPATRAKSRSAVAMVCMVGADCWNDASLERLESSSTPCSVTASATSANVCPSARKTIVPSLRVPTSTWEYASRNAGVRKVRVMSSSLAPMSPGSRTMPTTSRSIDGPSGSESALWSSASLVSWVKLESGRASPTPTPSRAAVRSLSATSRGASRSGWRPSTTGARIRS